MNKLSDRELLILQRLSEGRRDKEIGRELDLSANTVRGEVRLICARLDVRTRCAAVAKWVEKKLQD